MREQHPATLAQTATPAALVLGDETLLTLDETAAALHGSRMRVYRLHWKGLLPIYKFGASSMCKLGDIRRVVAELPRVTPRNKAA